MPTEALAQPPRKSRWLRFSLASTFAVTLLAAVLLRAYVVPYFEKLRRIEQHEVVLRDRRTVWEGAQSAIQTLEWHDDSSQPRAVIFRHDAHPAAVSSFLRRSPQLRSIDVNRRRVSLEEWEMIVSLPSLERLNLAHAILPLKGLDAAARPSKLKRLSLYDARVNEEQVNARMNEGQILSLLESPALEEVYLHDTSDRVCARLGEMPRLRTLGLSGAYLSPRQVRAIAGAPLRWLDMSNTHIDDEELAEVAAIKELKYLDVSRTRITLTGLDKLLALPELPEVRVQETGVSEADLVVRDASGRWKRAVRRRPLD